MNDRLETSVPGIWALGDCNGKGAFTHTSYNDFEIVAANLLDGATRGVSDRITAYALYIDPPLGRAGMTETEAAQSGHTVLVGKRPMTRVGRAVEKGETHGLMKIVVDARVARRFSGAAVLRDRRRRGDSLRAGHDVRESALPRPQARDAHPSDGVGADPDAARRARTQRVIAIALRIASRIAVSPRRTGRHAGHSRLRRIVWIKERVGVVRFACRPHPQPDVTRLRSRVAVEACAACLQRFATATPQSAM